MKYYISFVIRIFFNFQDFLLSACIRAWNKIEIASSTLCKLKINKCNVDSPYISHIICLSKKRKWIDEMIIFLLDRFSISMDESKINTRFYAKFMIKVNVLRVKPVRSFISIIWLIIYGLTHFSFCFIFVHYILHSNKNVQN